MNENYIPAAPVPEGNAPAPRKKGPGKLLLIGGIVLSSVAVVALIAAVALSVLRSPVTLVGTGIGNTVEALEENPAMSLLGDVAEGGSAELVVGLKELVAAAYGTQNFDGEISIKIYGNGEEGRGAAVAKLDLSGETFVDAALQFDASGEIVLASESLLAGEAYGVTAENFAENFEDSVFGPDGYLSLGIDSLEDYADQLQQSAEMQEKTTEFGRKLTEVLLKSLKKHAEITRENDELTFNGDSIRVTAVEIVLDNEAFAAVVADVIEFLREDESVEEFVEYYAETAEAQLKKEYEAERDWYEYYYDIYTYEEYCDYFYGGRVDYVADFYEALDEAEDELDDFDEFDKMTAVFYINKSRKELVGMDLKVRADGETEKITLRAGPTIEDLTEIELRVDSGSEDIVIRYEVDVNDKKEYVAKLTAEENGYDVLTVDLDWDKVSGAFSFMLTADDGYVEIKGDLKADKKSAELTVDSVNVMGEVVNVSFALKLLAEDKIPELFDEYIDVMTLTNSDLERLAGQIGAEVMSKLYTLDYETLMILEDLFGF